MAGLLAGGCELDSSRTKHPEPSKLFDSVLAITGDFPDGVAQSAQVRGDAAFFFDGKRLKVEVAIMGSYPTERGVIESLVLTNDGPDSTYVIRGKWNRDDEISADADFVLQCAGNEYPNTIKCKVGIQSGGWAYYAYKDVGVQQYQRIVSLMHSDEPQPRNEKSDVRRSPSVKSELETSGFDGASNVLLSDVLGHWTESSQDCDTDGGLWISAEGDSISLGGLDWRGDVVYSRHEEDRTYVRLRMIEDGEESAIEVQLGTRGGRLLLNPEFGQYCCGDGASSLIRCP